MSEYAQDELIKGRPVDIKLCWAERRRRNRQTRDGDFQMNVVGSATFGDGIGALLEMYSWGRRSGEHS